MTFQDLWQRITPLYDTDEAKTIVRMVLEDAFGLSYTDLYTGKVNELSADDKEKIEKMMVRLERAEPVQYVLGKEVFMGRVFHVEPGVLIPRPETEVLVRWVEEDYNKPVCALLPPEPLRILDIGTGSGAIAISLSLDILQTDVTAWDVSGDALLIARGNALRLGASINFRLQDVLNVEESNEKWDIIVSNPPYICQREEADMRKNVLDYEPHTALFVPDDDPLLFYRAIARMGLSTLTKGGTLYFETNPCYIREVELLLEELGYVMVQTRNDQFGKERFIKATLL